MTPDALQHWIQHNSSEELKLFWTAPWLEIQLNRPAQRNALNGTILQKLRQVFDIVEASSTIRAVILTGGEGQFCSGADLQEISQLRASGAQALVLNNKNYGELLHRMHLCRVPVIALVDGPALGGGMGLTCASDFILSTDNASFGMPEPKLGIIAGQIMPYVFRKLGLVKTQEMALQGLRITGQTAQTWGLSTIYCPSHKELRERLVSLLENILACGPLAIEQTKSILNILEPVSANKINETAQQVVAATLSAEGVEGTMAFLTKRKPKWNQKQEMESHDAG